MSYETITYEKKDGYALITLNRPEKLNAWTWKMSAEQVDAIQDANSDRDVGAIIVTGAGRGFCAGADIKGNFQSRLNQSKDEIKKASRNLEDQTGSAWVETVRSAKPMIAAVNGVSVGVGATMILPFDIIVASEDAKFGMFFVKMGLVPELASSHFLVQRVGFGKASELCLTGRLVEGEEAVQIGLADYLTDADGLLPKAIEIAEQIGQNPGPQLRMIKELLTENGSSNDIAAIQRRESDMLEKARASAEHKEAISAFLEKRPPNFKAL
jgi:enoyl-CoA hydratase/carnithine racemase